ncbi:olfactory receptor 8 [Danaus plexippus plexippus]|uniref:Odorant receptor n=1 Tax=Danaus plexippus plexippus TaxID=278856 RepID=A0A212FF61_DANPL|nr:olfactory receptor 8 [Danaus plexippus plexippus]
MIIGTKYVLEEYCKYVYYSGAGNFWYDTSFEESIKYKLYHYISFSIYLIMILLENLAALFVDFPEVEKKSAVMFSAIHDIILLKTYFLLFYKSSIKILNCEMASAMEEIEKENVMKQQKLRVQWGIIFYAVTVYLSLIAYGVESLRKVLVEGTPFYTVVTYIPDYYDESIIANALRIFFYMTWLYMMLPMMATDCMPIVHLITMAHKFKTLRHYFEDIRVEFDENLTIMGTEPAANLLTARFLNGVTMHHKLMFLAEEINRVFGIIMSLQVCESSAVAVLLLLRLALSSHLNLTNAFMTYTFVGSLFYLLALNLWNAGEITYEASLLSNSMFYSGWHLCQLNKHRHKDIRRLVLVGCAQAQKPLILKAFGIQDLSYSTFVSVSKLT